MIIRVIELNRKIFENQEKQCAYRNTTKGFIYLVFPKAHILKKHSLRLWMTGEFLTVAFDRNLVAICTSSSRNGPEFWPFSSIFYPSSEKIIFKTKF